MAHLFVLLASTISTAAIVGICIGLAALFSGLGGGAFAYGQAGGGAAPVSNNPLYEGKGFHQNNPLANM